MLSVYRYFYIPLSVIQYRKTNTQVGGENVHHGEDMFCCIGHGHHGRLFLTKEEKIKKLTEYKNWLENEAKGVGEAIAKLNTN